MTRGWSCRSRAPRPDMTIASETSSGSQLQPSDLGKMGDGLSADEPIQPWANLFSGNRNASNGMYLDYVPLDVVNGTITIQLEKVEYEHKIEKWNCALIVYIMGDTHGWSSVATPEVFYHKEDYYMSDKSLSMIGSAISIPLYVDECITKQSRIFFACVLHQTNVTKPLPDGIVVCAPDGGVSHQVVTYDWKPEFCEKFQKRVSVSRLRRLSNILNNLEGEGGLDELISPKILLKQLIIRKGFFQICKDNNREPIDQHMDPIEDATTTIQGTHPPKEVSGSNNHQAIKTGKFSEHYSPSSTRAYNTSSLLKPSSNLLN
ncbi:hypothetical protein H5410_047583 [Solanum commersonii]|uniref:Uncharacterized protein n=1 Tax=Solanum commersonii TaxID=4109 RepID=A0A9J5XHF0_SOLCO|nr:hypothetical protein H5410_047583 [Solanum commersonii]